MISVLPRSPRFIPFMFTFLTANQFIPLIISSILGSIHPLALHFAAANGHIECVRALIKAGAPWTKNENGNSPLHWSIQNKHADVTVLLLSTYTDADVLDKNEFGRSALTESFTAQDPVILNAVLEHQSAKPLEAQTPVEATPEEVAEAEAAQACVGGDDAEDDSAATSADASASSSNSKTKTKTASSAASASSSKKDKKDKKDKKKKADATSSKSSSSDKTQKAETSKVIQTVVHEFDFSNTKPVTSQEAEAATTATSTATTTTTTTTAESVPTISLMKPKRPLRVREVGMDWEGKVFDNEASEDTTGTHVWSAAVVCARWLVSLSDKFKDKSVVELGAGCGLPGLAVAAYSSPTEVSVSTSSGINELSIV
jgi:hypothetical protein